MNAAPSLARAVRALLATLVLLVGSAALAAEGDYVVAFPAGTLPPGFAERVRSVGGDISFAHAAAGIAVVHGMTDSTAAELATSAAITDVIAEVSFGISESQGQILDASDDGLAMSAVSRIASASHPEAAFFYGLGFQWNMQAIHADTACARGRLVRPPSRWR